MKISNRDFASIYKCYQEIIGTPEIKAEKQLTGHTVWQIVSKMIEMKPIFNALVDKEEELKFKIQTALNDKMTPQESQELNKKFEVEHSALFDDTFIEFEPYQMPLEVCSVIEKHLKTENTTFALFAYLLVNP